MKEKEELESYFIEKFKEAEKIAKILETKKENSSLNIEEFTEKLREDDLEEEQIDFVLRGFKTGYDIAIDIIKEYAELNKKACYKFTNKNIIKEIENKKY